MIGRFTDLQLECSAGSGLNLGPAVLRTDLVPNRNQFFARQKTLDCPGVNRGLCPSEIKHAHTDDEVRQEMA
jgi:hypothetical protein